MFKVERLTEGYINATFHKIKIYIENKNQYEELYMTCVRFIDWRVNYIFDCPFDCPNAYFY